MSPIFLLLKVDLFDFFRILFSDMFRVELLIFVDNFWRREINLDVIYQRFLFEFILNDLKILIIKDAVVVVELIFKFNLANLEFIVL